MLDRTTPRARDDALHFTQVSAYATPASPSHPFRHRVRKQPAVAVSNFPTELSPNAVCLFLTIWDTEFPSQRTLEALHTTGPASAHQHSHLYLLLNIND